MDFLRPALIKELHRLPHLGAPNNGIIDEHQALAPDQLIHRDQLHMSHQVPHFLIHRHKAPGPGGGVFDEGPGEGDSRVVSVADGVGNAGIRDTCDGFRRRMIVVFGHDLAVSTAHGLHVDPFVNRSGIAVVHPEECTDLHGLPGRG